MTHDEVIMNNAWNELRRQSEENKKQITIELTIRDLKCIINMLDGLANICGLSKYEEQVFNKLKDQIK